MTRQSTNCLAFAAVCLALSLANAARPCTAQDNLPDLKKDGAFGFPQAKATVVCDRKDLRVSVWNNNTHLYVQAIVKDGDSEGTDFHRFNGREFQDKADLLLDLDNNGRQTANVDRFYTLNPYLDFPGLRYVTILGKESTTGMLDTTKGRAATRFVDLGEGRKLRVDCFLLPLDELKKKPGDTIRLAYWGRSVKPNLTLNSTSFAGQGNYDSSAVPWDKFHAVKLASGGAALDLKLVPEDKQTLPPLQLKATSAEQKAKLENAFGLPSKEARLLCDNDELRLSAWSNDTHLYVQAILWQDNEGEKRVVDQGREFKDHSSLELDLDADRKLTPKVDRSYHLSPNTSNTGLKYSVPLTATSSTGTQGDSKGRGSIRHVALEEGRQVRVDCYLLPLAELGRKPGQTIRLAYYAKSAAPKFTLNSVGFVSAKPYYQNQLPHEKYQDLKLESRDTPLDPEQVPDDERRDPD